MLLLRVVCWGTIAKWLRRLIRISSNINSSLRAQVRILLVSAYLWAPSFFLFFFWGGRI